MEDYIQFSAKTKNEAITKACLELGTSSDQLDIQVISEGSSGFFGIGKERICTESSSCRGEEAGEERSCTGGEGIRRSTCKGSSAKGKTCKGFPGQSKACT